MGSAPRVEVGRVLAGYARATVSVLGMAAALALSGCSDGAGAQTGPTSSGPSTSATTSATASSSSTTSRPSSTAAVSIPAAARAHTEEGAKAFAEFYLNTYSEAAVSADSAALAALSGKSCGGCRSLIDLIDGYRAKHQHVDEVSLTIDTTMLRPEGTSDRPVVDVLAADAKKRVLNADGSVAKTVAGANINFRLTLNWSEIGWQVEDLRVVQ
jgi:hypothetical protein